MAGDEIIWKVQPKAKSYIVTVDGKVVCRTTETTCEISALIGPKSKVFVTAVNGDVEATPTKLVYKSSGPVLVFVVNFNEGSSRLTTKAKSILTSTAKKMVTLGFTSLAVTGYTDNQGGAKGASALSKARAVAVSKFVGKYLKVSAVTVGRGNTNFVSTNATEAGRAANRRAEGTVR